MKKSFKQNLSNLTNDFIATSQVQRLDDVTPVLFLRECVSSYSPAILNNLIHDWEAYKKWNLEYLQSKLNDKLVHVNFTNDGRADSVQHVQIEPNLYESRFIYPSSIPISFSSFLDMLIHPQVDDAIPYLSEQNDNLREEFSELLLDIPKSISLAKEAFDLESPEAINLWIGDERSVSSIHKDYFENFYVVLYGTKTFTLYPPTDVAFFPQHTYKTAQYQYKYCNNSPYTDNTIHSPLDSADEISSGEDNNHVIHTTISDLYNDNNPTRQYHQPTPSCRIKKEDIYLSTVNCPSEEVAWIPIDPNEEICHYYIPMTSSSSSSLSYQSTSSSPSSLPSSSSSSSSHNTAAEWKQMIWTDKSYTHPIHIKVHAGEVLYIPAMWYHRVSQTEITIAVNYWYDQKFDYRYVCYEFVKSLSTANNNDNNDDDDDDDDNQEDLSIEAG